MRIVSFDGVTFGRQDESETLPLEMKTATQVIPMADGAFDYHGDNQYRQPLSFTRKFLLSGTAIAADLDELREKTNKRGWLVVQTRSSVNRGTWAKLTSVNYTNSPEQTTYLPVSLSFVINWPWFELSSDVWYFDAGEVFDDGLSFDGNYTTQSGAGTFVINNTGGGVIKRGTVEIAGASTAPTITNAANGWSIAYSGTVASGSKLIIDIGAQTAEVDAVSVWDDITLGNDQTGLMQLETGSNSITFTGGGTLVWHWAKVY